MVTSEIAHLERGLGAADRAIVADYLDSVREIERRVELLSVRDLSGVDVPAIPVAVPDFDARLRLMFDLLAVAYQTNMTRIATFMMAAEVSNTPYPHVGVPDAFHPLSHHAENKQSIEKLTHRAALSQRGVRRLPREARRHCPTEMRARCSTTRYSCTAAT